MPTKFGGPRVNIVLVVQTLESSTPVEYNVSLCGMTLKSRNYNDLNKF